MRGVIVTTPRRRRVPKLSKPSAEKSWREMSADHLKHIRETLGTQIQQRMSEYTNQHLWENAKSFIPFVPEENDPEDIKNLKNYFLILHYAENAMRSGKNILRLVNELIGIYNSLSSIPSLSKTFRSALEETLQIINILKSRNDTTDSINKQIQSAFSKLTNSITEKIYTLLSYRKPAPTNPAMTFTLPPEWYDPTFVPVSRTEEELVNL